MQLISLILCKIKKRKKNDNLMTDSSDGGLNALNLLKSRVMYTTFLLSISAFMESTDVLNAIHVMRRQLANRLRDNSRI